MFFANHAEEEKKALLTEKIEGLSSLKDLEDFILNETYGWSDALCALIYAVLYHRGFRIDQCRNILNKVKSIDSFKHKKTQ